MTFGCFTVRRRIVGTKAFKDVQRVQDFGHKNHHLEFLPLVSSISQELSCSRNLSSVLSSWVRSDPGHEHAWSLCVCVHVGVKRPRARARLVSLCLCAPAQLLSHVHLFATPGTVAHQAPLSMEFSRQECWSGLPFPPPGVLPDPGIDPTSPV